MIEEIKKLVGKRQALLGKLVEPVRAAANQMKDAGMARGADPLLELIFQLDAVDAELQELYKRDPAEAMGALLDLITGEGKR